MTPSSSITVITSPYHVGMRNHGVGKGPSAILNANLIPSLRSLGIPVHVEEVPPVDSFEGEIGRSFELIRRTSASITAALDKGSFPIVLAGNCFTEVGVAAGVAGAEAWKQRVGDVGCVWFDAHDDFNTPDVLASGYFDSMGVAMLGGDGWKGLLGTVPNFTPMDLRRRFVHVGMRDVTPVERSRVEDAGFSVIWGSTTSKVAFADGLAGALAERALPAAMIHLDLDSLDPTVGVVNKFSAEGGLLEEDLRGCLGETVARTRVVSMTVASYDPGFDVEEKIPRVAVGAVLGVVEKLLGQGVIVKE